MPLPYSLCMTPQERLVAIACLLARKDRNDFTFNHKIFSKYLPVAQQLIRKNDFLILPYMEQMLTSRCSLRCRHCANLMQYYRPDQQITYTLDECVQNLNRLLACVDYIVWFRLLGGEPLLLSWLPDLVLHALQQQKIGRVEIVTNGTIMPSSKLLAAMSSPRASFDFSNYGTISRKLPQILPLVEDAGINYSLNPSYTWEDMGDMSYRNYTVEQASAVYSACNNICKNLVGQEVHVCPRSANGMLLGLIPHATEDYVDIFAQNIAMTRAKLRELFDVQSIKACQYCNAPADRKTIPAGEQITA